MYLITKTKIHLASGDTLNFREREKVRDIEEKRREIKKNPDCVEVYFDYEEI
jgi:hypothetical protein